jgi:16S rRNA (guanine527-N7)-methyltransferase
MSTPEERLRALVAAVLEENTKLNLTAMRTPEQCWTGNVQDSLALLDLLPELLADQKDLRIADIGTGGGFPLLPLAVCLPDATLVGMDSVAKKVEAVKRIMKKMELKNVKLVAGRLEELGRDDKHREAYDLITARAVAPINVLLEYCSPLAKVGGWVVLWKSLHAVKELEESLLARAELSCHLERNYEYDLGEEWGKRQLLVFKKTAGLLPKYPRGVGVPKKEPLL